MNEREKEARDEHRIDFMFGPDLTPREQAKAENAEQEKDSENTQMRTR